MRHNIELMIPRLRSAGWRFSNSDVYPIWAPPHQKTTDQIAELERRLKGPISLALKTFWSVVGTVSFMRQPSGYDEDLSLPDPLVVGPVDHALTELSDWEDDEERRSEPFRAPIAPDALHKDDISGGAPYEIALPDSAADTLLLNEPHDTTFVSYLRIALAAGGLPGWEDSERHAPLLKRLADGLQAF
ncbi:MAG: hypothetical protein ACREOY_09470 [Candidatus Dormibacteraceae bacterium]